MFLCSPFAALSEIPAPGGGVGHAVSEARSAAAAFEPADVIQDGVRLRLEDEVAAATRALGLRWCAGFDGGSDLRTEFEELAEDEEHPASSDSLHELVDFLGGPFGELTTLDHVLADFLEVVGLAEVLDFADREILIDELGPAWLTAGMSSQRTSRSQCAWTCQPRCSLVISMLTHPPRTPEKQTARRSLARFFPKSLRLFRVSVA